MFRLSHLSGLLTVGAVVFVASSAEAATASYRLRAETYDDTTQLPNGYDAETQQVGSDLKIDLTVETGTGPTTAAKTTYDADYTTGIIALDADAIAGAQFIEDRLRTSQGSGRNVFGISETFTAVGDGMVTFKAGVTGFLSQTFTEGFGANANASALFALNGNVRGGGDNRATSLSYDLDGLSLAELSVDDMMSITLEVEDGDSFNLAFSGSYQASAFSQRTDDILASLSFDIVLSSSTSTGLIVTPGDPNFLTDTIPDDPDFPSVPLPASWPLVLAGLGAFGAIRARQSR